MRHRSLRWVGLAVTVLVGALVLGGGWLIGTASGTAWSLQFSAQWVPGLALHGVRGTWQDGIAIDQLSYEQPDGMAVTVDALQLGIEIRRGRRVALEPLTASAVRVALPPAAEVEAPSRPQLPAFSLPLRLTIPTLAIDTVTVEAGEMVAAIQALQASLSWTGARIDWRRLALRYDAMALRSEGSLQLRDDYPLEVRMQITHSAPAAALQVTATGELDALRVQLRLDQPWRLTAEAELDLLDPALPLRLDAELTQAATLPGDIDLAAASVTARGTRHALAGEFTASADLPQYPASALSVPFHWDGAELTLMPLVTLGSAQGELRAECRIAPLDDIAGACDGRLDALDLTPWLATDARISTDIAVQLDAVEPLQLNGRLAAIDGTIAGQPLEGDVKVEVDGSIWRLGDSQLRAGANQLAVTGALGSGQSLAFRLDLPEPQLLTPGASGSLVIDGTASGELGSIALQARMDGQALGFGDTLIGSLRSTLEVAELGRAPSRLHAELENVSQGALRLDAAALTVAGTLDDHQLSVDLQGLAELALIRLRCNGRSNAALSELTLACPEWSTLLDLEGDAWHWQLAQPLRLSWHAAPQRLRLEPFCLDSVEGDLCLVTPLRWENGQLAALRLRSEGIDLRRATALLPSDAVLRQTPALVFDINLQSIQPLNLVASASISPTTWQWPTGSGTEETLLDTLTLDLRADDRRAALTVATRSPDTGALDAAITVQDPLGRRELAGSVGLSTLRLEAFQWLMPQLNAAGLVDVDLRLGGTVGSPTLAGEARLTNGSAQLEAIGQPIEQATLIVRFDQQAADFNGSLMLAPGRARLDGRLIWEDPAQWQLSAQVAGERLHIQPLPGSTVALSPALQIEATPERIDVTGQVDIPKAALHIEELPPSAARVSPDAEWVGAATDQQRATQLFANVAVNLGEEVRFQGFGADVWLAGGMRVRHNPAQGLRATGEVQVSRGRYRAYGQRLIIRRGSFLFTGPLENPELNLEAIRELPPTADDQVVGIRVLGPLRNPHAELFAEPSMAESDIAYFMLTGRPPPDAGSTQQVSAAGALLTLGVAGSGDQTARLAERFGIHDFQVSTHETASGTQATVSGYLSPRLYVRYGAGIRDGSNSIAFQYRLTSKLVLEAVSGLEEALDLLYSFTIE